jgi:hypothetical protein
MNTENSLQNKLADKLAAKFPVLEMIFVFALIVGLIIKIFGSGIGGTILVLSSGCLAIIYFLQAQTSITSNNSGLSRFIYKLIFLASSVSVLGILFRLQHYPASGNLILIGCLAIIAALIFALLKKIELSRTIIIRSVIIIIIGLALNYTSLGKFDQPKEKQATEIN